LPAGYTDFYIQHKTHVSLEHYFYLISGGGWIYI
jgi:hypothetical protein